jgi:hypothetical protein
MFFFVGCVVFLSTWDCDFTLLFAHCSYAKCKLYLKIILCLVKAIQIPLQLSISALQIYSLIIQNNSGRLFQTISFLQLLFILLKFYFIL